MGSGFIIDPKKAYDLGLGTIAGLENHILPYRNGRDLTDVPRGVFGIDFFGLSESDVLLSFPTAYQHLLENVKPERDQNNRASYRKNWWIFGEARATFRPAFSNLQRYIVGPRVAKHRFFTFQRKGVLPDDKQIVIASDDAYFLGVVSSKIHTFWVLASGGNLGVGNDPVYDSSRCFQPFPFPDATPDQQARIREVAEQLDAHRKRQQAQHATLTLTDLYNVVEKLRAGEPLTAKDQTINQQGLASVVLSLHQQLDAAVADAYGWPDGLPAADILTRLVALNQERAREEQAGTIRYLRLAYQRFGGPTGRNGGPQQQMGIDLGSTDVAAPPVAAAAEPVEWPKELAQQMQAVRNLVQQGGQPLTASEVAARFKRTKVDKVKPLLDTLTALALLRLTPAGTYAG